MRKVRTNYDRTRWTADEIARLRELAPVYPARQVAELMGRPYPSVRAKMMREGIEACRGHNWNEWSHDELVFLEENHEAMEPEEIAARLSRTVASPSVRSAGIWTLTARSTATRTTTRNTAPRTWSSAASCTLAECHAA